MTPRHHKLFWGSSYDRGSDYLLFIWGDIKKQYEDAELHLCYGWDMFDKVVGNNQERRQWQAAVKNLMKQPGVTEHGRLGKEELAKVRKSCGIWAYPTDFPEINCITALDAQSDGLVPVVTNFAALQETVQSGIKVDGDIRTPEVIEKYKQEVLDLMGDPDRWKILSKKAETFAKNYQWEKIAPKWVKEFEKPIQNPKVSIITPTIRHGFWNVMASNLADQDYQNFEWIIVDDAKEDRSEIAKKYAEKYDLDIKYVRGEHAVKRIYGLSSANNTGAKAATGELLVFLQDFVLIPDTGIEQLVDVYRHNPDALIAPTDVYHHTSIKPNMDNLEDWFDHLYWEEVIGEFYWENARNRKLGLRESFNAPDFEMNYGAIPKHIVEALGGWWEFFDDGLGYDNTEIAYRALEAGYRLLIDDTNVAVCLDLWEHIAGSDENVKNREFNLNDPRYFWMIDQMNKGNLPLKRTQEIDNKITWLNYTIDPTLGKEGAAQWIEENGYKVVEKWRNYVR
jgi:glycosyltransferase involved in cell wall biosynthesis